jgi:hypothetical protein
VGMGRWKDARGAPAIAGGHAARWCRETPLRAAFSMHRRPCGGRATALRRTRGSGAMLHHAGRPRARARPSQAAMNGKPAPKSAEKDGERHRDGRNLSGAGTRQQACVGAPDGFV